MSNVSVSDGVTGLCSVCGRMFWGADEDKLRATIIRHRITNDPPCDDRDPQSAEDGES